MKIYLASTAPNAENDQSLSMKIYQASFHAKEVKEPYNIINRLLSYWEISINQFGCRKLFDLLTEEMKGDVENENKQSGIAESPGNSKAGTGE